MEFGRFRLDDYKDCLVVTDKKIAQLYDVAGDNVYLLPEGESAKSFANVQQLCKWFLSKNLTKGGKVVAVGGGSIGDTVGFACSIFKRGVPLLHVPTTLVAMVDSAIGGKTALDFDSVKNAVGTIYPAETLIDVNFLHTLDKEQLTNGLGEIVKYRMLDETIDKVFACGDLKQTIKVCAEYKQRICDVDLLDNNLRKKLNFGHTIGHAMELSLGIAHGLAVLNGIYYETLLAKKLGLCSNEYCQKWQNEVQKLVDVAPCLTESMLELTLQDKKNIGDNVVFVLPSSFDVVQLSLQKVKELLLDK